MLLRNKWAANYSKLERAIRIAGEGASEEKIKEVYVLLGGKVLDIQEPIQEEDEKNDDETPSEDIDLPVKSKRGRPKKQVTNS